MESKFLKTVFEVQQGFPGAYPWCLPLFSVSAISALSTFPFAAEHAKFADVGTFARTCPLCLHGSFPWLAPGSHRGSDATLSEVLSHGPF